MLQAVLLYEIEPIHFDHSTEYPSRSHRKLSETSNMKDFFLWVLDYYNPPLVCSNPVLYFPLLFPPAALSVPH